MRMDWWEWEDLAGNESCGNTRKVLMAQKRYQQVSKWNHAILSKAEV
jgi:hypothetical protein